MPNHGMRVEALCRIVVLLLLVVAAEGCERHDAVAMQLDEVEHLVNILEVDRPADEMLAHLEYYVSESRERRIAIGSELEEKSPETVNELEMTHGDRLQRLMHRLAIARRRWRTQLRNDPDSWHRFRRATADLSNLFVEVNPAASP